jgi:hypothetical protein
VNAGIVIGFIIAATCPLAVAADREPSIQSAAAKYLPGVTWRAGSVVSGDFSCRGRKEWAILGINATEIVVAVFLNGKNKKPEVVPIDARAGDWYPPLAELFLADLDYDPDVYGVGDPLPGFRRSKTCKGLRLDDGRVDPANIYWNHDSHHFVYWSN